MYVLWEFELSDADSRASFQRSILHADVFDHFVAPILVEKLEGWDNFSEDHTYRPMEDYKPGDHDNKTWLDNPEVERHAHRSFDDCKAACRALPDCLQFYHKGKQCNINKKIRLGWEVPGENVTSGWMLDRIEALRKEAEPCSI